MTYRHKPSIWCYPCNKLPIYTCSYNPCYMCTMVTIDYSISTRNHIITIK